MNPAGLNRFEQPESPKRVLVWVRGGVADYATEPGVEVLLMDYDNELGAEIPNEFRRLGSTG